jgi:hypothetical protein
LRSDFVALISGRVTCGLRDLVEGQIPRLGVEHGLLELRLEQRTAAGPPGYVQLSEQQIGAAQAAPADRSAGCPPPRAGVNPDVRVVTLRRVGLSGWFSIWITGIRR